jgi:hypothetical protein
MLIYDMLRPSIPVLFLLMGSSARADLVNGATVVVAAQRSLLRAQGSAHAEVVLAAGRNAEFKVTGSAAGWVKVSIAGGGEGWLPRAELGTKVDQREGVCVELDIAEALSLGALDGGFHGNGAAFGDSVMLHGKNSMRLAVCPQVRAGLKLENTNSAAQNMVLANLRGVPMGLRIRPAAIRFEPGVETVYMFEAYCLDFAKSNPSRSDRLLPSGAAPDTVQRILGTVRHDVRATQLAVWAVQDNITAEQAVIALGANQTDIQNAKQIVQSAGLSPNQLRLFRD